ncbi:MAG TPA: hypothetical protein VFJ05_05980, partial [Nitrososphaeraceae archaeon]|nr:hypothetical protein [Nitrososphaeraceae archaeon]
AKFRCSSKCNIWRLSLNSLILPSCSNHLVCRVVYDRSKAAVTNIKAATGALSFYSYPKNILEKGLSPERLGLQAAYEHDASVMAKELGALY